MNVKSGTHRPFWKMALLITGIAAVAVITGCSTSTPDMPVTFGDGNECYYVKSPTEVVNLKKQNHCPQSAQPAQAPTSWVESYYPFYRSDWYESNIVPSSEQSSYWSYMTAFGKMYAGAINVDAPEAEYLDGSGNVVSGNDAGVSSDGTSISENGGGGPADGGGGGGGGE